MAKSLDVWALADTSFLTQTSYRGAFASSNNWLSGWSKVDESGITLKMEAVSSAALLSSKVEEGINLVIASPSTYGLFTEEDVNASITQARESAKQEVLQQPEKYGLVNNATHESSVNVSANITSDTTWSASNTYVLKDYIFVEPGATLTIEAGTTIKADVGSGDGAPALIVTQGAKINAVGTASAPIVFTSVNDTGSNLTKDDKGLWGGLIILGNAPINSNGGSNADNSPLTNTIEGVPTTSGISGKTIPASYAQYGGTNASDNSGVLQYVSIRHGGAEIGAGNEINGLTLGGVGNGTTMDHIEIFANKDDGIEFFGGSVNAKYLTVAYVGDDSFDIDEGYNGHLQFLLSIQDENSNRAFEWDGSTESDDRAADTSTLPSYSAPVISNVTAIGIGKDGTSNHEDNNIGLEIRDNAGGQIWNSIFTEFAKSIMDVEKTASSKGTQSTTDTSVYGSQALMQNGTLVFK